MTTIPTTSKTDQSSAERVRFEGQTAAMGKRIENTIAADKEEKQEKRFAPSDSHDVLQDKTTPVSLRQQIIKSRIAAVEDPSNKNPFRFTHGLDQQAATFARAKRIIANPKFAALPDDHKERILSNYYDKYVIPVYHHNKLEAPDKQVWLRQIQNNFFKTSDFYEYSQDTNPGLAEAFKSAISHAQASAVEAAGHLGHAIILGGVATDRKILGLANFLPGSALHSYVNEQADFDAKLAQPVEKFSQDVIDRPQFWLDTHPSKTFTEKAGSFVGENLVQLPLYEAIGGALSGMGKVVSTIGSMGRAANLTRRLMSNKTGQFVAKRLGEGASAYIGDVFSESKPEDRATDIAVFMGIGVAGDAFKGAIKLSRNSMKKVAAENIAIGGKVFHEQVADQAEFELTYDIIGTGADGNPILHEEGKFNEQMDAAHKADPVKHSVVTAEKISQNAVARQLYGKPLRELSQLQRRKVRIELVKMAAEATKEIPIHIPEVAHHEVQQSIQEDVQNNPALANVFAGLEKKYGKKIEDVLVKEEQNSIAESSGIKSSQGATRRVGKNEKILGDATEGVGKTGTPIKLRSQEEIDSLNPKKPDRTREQNYFLELHETGNLRYNSGDQGYNVKFQSPVDKALYKLTSRSDKAIKSQPDALKKLRAYFDGTKSDTDLFKMGQEVKAQLDAEVKSRRPVYNQDPVKHSEINFPTMHKFEPSQKVKDDIPKNYVSFRTKAVANFTNPFNSRAKEAKQTLAKFLEGMDDADFVQEISDQMGNQIKFEKPFDMLLWGLHHSEHIPSPITKKIVEVLHDQDPSGTIKEWKDEARRLGAHIDMLAMSGRLSTEGNVFRSTITTSFTGRTRWQREAEQEAAKEELENFKNTMVPYKKNFRDAYNEGLKQLAKLQVLRRASKTDEDFFAAHDKIKKILENTPPK